MITEQIITLRKQLKSKLEPMRFEHSVSVSFTCTALAMRYGYDIQKAELAGLMHDCAKRFTDSELIRKYGAYLAENKYGIQDPEIISAIACHTTGKPDMSTLDKILYIADYIEPRRDKADNLPQMRYLAFQDLDETMYEILKGTLEYLDKKGNTIDPMTLQAYEYFAEAMKQKKANMHI